MKITNCNINEFLKLIKNKKLVVWGIGKALVSLANKEYYCEVLNHVDYCIDSNGVDEIEINDRRVDVYSPEKLLKEDNCVVLICSTKYAYEIYQEINKMNLPDSIECCALANILRFPDDKNIEQTLRAIDSATNNNIPKTIHTFWFSGDPYPNDYEKCLNSWKKYCPGYEIKIWDKNSYDYKKNPFVNEAIKTKKWAFAADYARLDILYNYGGLYMDMDVELLKSPDRLLNHEGVFSMHDNVVDLAVFASKEKNPILRQLLDKYNELSFSHEFEIQKNILIQPKLLRPVFEKMGVVVGNQVQVINDNLFLPAYVMLSIVPEDWNGRSLGDWNFSIHHCNAGWYDEELREEWKAQKENVAKLWNIFRSADIE